MSRNTHEAVTAFRAADPIPADAYVTAAHDPDATASMHQIMAMPIEKPPIEKTPRPWRHPITIGATATAAAAIAVAAAVGVATTGGTGQFQPPVSNAAYSVRTNPDGSVTVTVHNWRANLTELAKELQKRGVPALPPPNPPGKYNCHYKTTGPEGSGLDAAGRAIVNATRNTFTVRPDKLPYTTYMVIGEHLTKYDRGFGVEFLSSTTRPTVTCD